MARAETFKGYGPEQGYDFLVEAIAEHDYGARGVKVGADEIFVSDGTKCDSGNIQEIFATDCVVALTDPVYPVYVDTNVMAGRTGAGRRAGPLRGHGLPAVHRGQRLRARAARRGRSTSSTSATRTTRPAPSRRKAQLQSVGGVRARAQRGDPLRRRLRGVHPRSRASRTRSTRSRARARCAIEFRSFSKTAGFTGVRCAFTVVPKEAQGRAADGSEVSLHALWLPAQRPSSTARPTSSRRRRPPSTRRRASARSASRSTSTWRTRASSARGWPPPASPSTAGGTRPTSGCRTPRASSSWEFFDRLLNQAHVVGTPGAGFGPSGEGYFRLTAFGGRDADAGGGRAHPHAAEPVIRRVDLPEPRAPEPCAGAPRTIQ